MNFKLPRRWFSFLCFAGIALTPFRTSWVKDFFMTSNFEDNIVWIDNYSEAIAQAEITGKPIFLEFRCVP